MYCIYSKTYIMRQCIVLLFVCMCSTVAAQSPGYQDCSIADRITGDVEIYHIGTYKGTSELGAAIELDNSGHDVKKIDVLANMPNKNIVLVMTAYDPVVWNVAWTTGTEIKGAVVSGYHGQAVLGIPKSVPLYLKTALGNKTIIHDPVKSSLSSSCPYLYSLEDDKPRYAEIIKKLQKIVGRSVTQYIQVPNEGIVIVGDAMPVSLSALEYSTDYSLVDFTVKRQSNEVPAGKWGLKELVKKGVIRHALQADIRSFEASGVKGIVHGQPTYVVLKKMKMPDGLYGGHSVNILVPTGVPMPSGPRGHNSFCRFGQPKCEGLP